MTTEGSFQADLCRASISVRDQLVAQRCDAGFWRGELSSSALFTAAAFALHQAGSVAHREAIARALRRLTAHVNSDGGWGDSPASPSSLSTTLLCWSALAIADSADAAAALTVRGAERWIDLAVGGHGADALAAAVVAS